MTFMGDFSSIVYLDYLLSATLACNDKCAEKGDITNQAQRQI